MSEQIKHECGIALIRLLRPLDFYYEKYGTALYGLNKLYLLMEKQYNRGQDGAGIATIKLDMPPGQRYISRYRSMAPRAVTDIFEYVRKKFDAVRAMDPKLMDDCDWLKHNVAFIGEVLMGHLRYGTHGRNSIEKCHPFLRQNNWMTRNLVLSGNFNMTNVDELLETLYELGQHPKEKTDTVTVLEKIGHFLDVENQALFDHFKTKGYDNASISRLIAEHLDVTQILRRSAKDFDGGYAIQGMFGHGDAFVLRDPSGIRPAYFYQNDEVVVVASERPAIQAAFNVKFEDLEEVKPGHALIIKKNGSVTETKIREPLERKSCSFERIYFSKGSDAEIYRERKMLGKLLVPHVLRSVNYDIEHTVFSYIPNTAEVAFYGMKEGIKEYIRDLQKQRLQQAHELSPEQIDEILNMSARIEKIPIKDTKLRTFITQDSDRNELVNHTYDVTYGVVEPGVDTIVVLDDSIVRGTTLQQSILRMLDRLEPRKIIIASSAPQIRYPDCYGIDMSRMGEFVAFQAMMSLADDDLVERVYEKCKTQEELPRHTIRNYVKELYDQFSYEEISREITRIITPPGMKAEVEVIYQTLDGLHQACPKDTGDWYFSGNYPTPGGNRVVNRAFMYYMEGKNQRAYL
ncbi:MAG: amidophosphoribosyltransferase [Solitalea sp.]